MGLTEQFRDGFAGPENFVMQMPNIPPTSTQAKKHVVIVAPDRLAVDELVGYVPSTEFEIAAHWTSVDSSSEALDADIDVVIVKARPGGEMAGYHLGRMAAQRGIGILFVTKHADKPAIQAMASAVPHAIMVEFPCSNHSFAESLRAADLKRKYLFQERL